MDAAINTLKDAMRDELKKGYEQQLGRRLPIVLGGQGRSAASLRKDLSGWLICALWALALVVLIVGFLVMR